jgi:hypothetical protein
MRSWKSISTDPVSTQSICLGIYRLIITRAVIQCLAQKMRALADASKPPARRGIWPHLLDAITDKLTFSRRA